MRKNAEPILGKIMEDEDVDIDDLDFVPPRKPSPSNIAPVDVKRLLNDKTYRQALPTPKATSNRFRNRLHKMPPYNFRLCFENNSCPELPSATTMERGGWFHVGWLNGRMAFCTYNFAAMPRGATVTTATSPVLILTSWGTEGKAVRLSDHSPAFKLVQNWSTLEFLPEFVGGDQSSDRLQAVHGKIVRRLDYMWNDGDVEIVPLEMIMNC
jgi:hypothetical protein